MDNPYEWLSSAIDQVPELLQPLIVALAAAIPYIEGEGASAFGILAGIHPIIAGMAAATGNILCVVLVVLLGSRVREWIVRRRAASTAPGTNAGTAPVEERPVMSAAISGSGGTALPESGTTARNPVTGSIEDSQTNGEPTRGAKGRKKLRRWMVKFGVPGASLLAPLALPTMLTAAFFVGSGVPKRWVILWQIIAIVLWTGLVTVAATGALAFLGW